MALIDRHHEPSARQLILFGVAQALFFGLIGGIVQWRYPESRAPLVLWVIGGALTLLFFAISGLRLLIYRMWMGLTYPIGWTLSHFMLIVVYYGWITPMSFLMRLFGYDPMRRRQFRSGQSHWVRRKPSADIESYFRQY